MDRPAHQVNPEPARKPIFFWVAAALTTLVSLFLLVGIYLIGVHWRDIPAEYGSPFSITVLILVSISMLAMAAVMGLIRPGFPTARLGFWAGLSGSVLFLTAAVDLLYGTLRGWEHLVRIFLIRPLPFAIGYHFLSQFPAPFAENAAWRTVRYVLYAVAIWLWLPRFVSRVAIILREIGWSTQFAQIYTLPGWYEATLPGIRSFLYVAAGCAMLAVVIRNYRGLQDEQERRRMRYGAIGAVPAMLALLVVGVLRIFSNAFGTAGAMADAVARMAYLSVPLAPMSLAYAVIKHRLLGIRVVVRRGLQYLLAKRTLQLILLLPVLLIVVELARNPHYSLIELLRRGSLTGNLLLLGSAAAGLRYRKWIEGWLDKKFFRTAYSQERILMELLDDVKQADSLHELSMLVAGKIDAALHPKDICVWFAQESGRFTQEFPAGRSRDRVANLLRERDVLDALENGHSRPILVSGGFDPQTAPDVVPEASLVVPLISSGGKLSGVLWLDEKKSEEPYSGRDRDLLQAIAGQMAIVYENLQLREKLLEEQRVRIDVMGRLDVQSFNLLKECMECGRCYDRTVDNCTVDGASLTMTLPVERVIDQKYRLDRRLGAGGMGTVYEATDLRLSRRVAVKVMVGRLFGNRSAIRRFEREARAAARLSHPNIVAIYDFGRLEGDGAYLVLEFLDGVPLRNRVTGPRKLDMKSVAASFDQLCQALSAAHGAGIVHRDLKPENIFLTSRGGGVEQLVVLDFGLAKMRDMTTLEASQSGITATGVVMGTLRYMSPEQLAGRELDARSDLYAVGLLLVEVLFGGFPARVRELFPWIIHRVSVEEKRHPEWNSAPLAALLCRLLAEAPEERIASADQLREELIPILEACPNFGINPPAADESQHGMTRTVV